IRIDDVVEKAVDDEEIVDRSCGSRVNPGSGRTYEQEHDPAEQAGKDEVTSEEVSKRQDDNEETVGKRRQVYHTQTKPLVDFYQKLSAANGEPKCSRVEGVGSVEEITARVLSALS